MLRSIIVSNFITLCVVSKRVKSALDNHEAVYEPTFAEDDGGLATGIEAS